MSGNGQVGDMSSWRHFKLRTCQVWEMIKLRTRQVGKLSSWGHFKLGNDRVEDMSSWGHVKLGTCRIGEFGSCQVEGLRTLGVVKSSVGSGSEVACIVRHSVYTQNCDDKG